MAKFSDSKDPIESTAKGVTLGILEFTKKEIKNLVKKHKEGKLAFIEDIDTIDLAKEIKKTGEFQFFKKYLKKNKDHRILFQMGLTLRRMEKEGRPIEYLQKKILNKYNEEGLHIAYFIQNGLLIKYMNIVLEKSKKLPDISLLIKELFENIDDLALFLKALDSSKNRIFQQSKKIISKIVTQDPDIFVISGSKSAMEVCEQVQKIVFKEIKSDYSCEYYGSSADKKRIYFFIRKKPFLAI